MRVAGRGAEVEAVVRAVTSLSRPRDAPGQVPELMGTQLDSAGFNRL